MSEISYSDWLKAQFTRHKDKTKADLARELGLEPPAVSKILNGDRQVKAREYEIMRKFFGLPTHTRTSRAALNKDHTPQKNNLREHEEDTDRDQWLIPAEITPNSSTISKEALSICEVLDNLMSPFFVKGEYVVLDTSDNVPSPEGIFAVSDKFNTMIRDCAIVAKSTPIKVKITARQNEFQQQTLKLSEFEILGRVIGKVNFL
ncbi:MAG: helix-turn-helix domain-containing protein [Micavibrio sp.]|nr:helix-turn-helix domain-containing protein [Micavibrio sp.]